MKDIEVIRKLQAQAEQLKSEADTAAARYHAIRTYIEFTNRLRSEIAKCFDEPNLLVVGLHGNAAIIPYVKEHLEKNGFTWEVKEGGIFAILPETPNE